MLALAGAALGAGWPVLLDGVFMDPAERRAVADLAARHGVAAEGLWLQAPKAALLRRVGGRRGDASDAGAEVVERQLRRGAVVDDWPALDAGGGVEATATAARRLLGLPG
jgi:predicted kinase